MKKKLLSFKSLAYFLNLLIFCFSINSGFSQTNLVLNGTADEYTVEADNAATGAVKNVNDNADAFDMTPSSKLIDNNGNEVSSPYRSLWNNSNLDGWLDTNCGDNSELPASTADGNFVDGVKTRGYKLNEACRRLYQVIEVVQGKEYTFSIESRSEAENVPTEVFILNKEIENETNLSSSSADVDAYSNITNDYNPNKSSATENNFTTTTFTFTASQNKVVIYVRAPLAIDSDNEVFYDNISLVAASNTTSINEAFAKGLSVYPNPTKSLINISSNIEINKVEVFNVIGKKVSKSSKVTNNQIDISYLPKGIYMLKITSENAIATKKIIKE